MFSKATVQNARENYLYFSTLIFLMIDIGSMNNCYLFRIINLKILILTPSVPLSSIFPSCIMGLKSDVIYHPPHNSWFILFVVCLLVSFRSFNLIMPLLHRTIIFLQLLGTISSNYNAFFAIMVTNPTVRLHRCEIKRNTNIFRWSNK